MFWPVEVRPQARVPGQAARLLRRWPAWLAGLYLQLREQQRTWAVSTAAIRRASCPVTTSWRSRTSARRAACPSPPRPTRCGRGWCRWAGAVAAGTATTRSTWTPPAPTPSSRSSRTWPRATWCRPHPGGGFVAKVVEPGQALVLYLDTELVTSQGPRPKRLRPMTLRAGRGCREADEDLPAGLRAAGAMGGLAMPDFRATLGLRARARGRRRHAPHRAHAGLDRRGGLPQRLGLPLMGLGVFAMTRKHMLGRQGARRAPRQGRAEQPDRSRPRPESVTNELPPGG